MWGQDKGRLFGKINIVDICVILIVVLAVGLTYFKFNKSAHSDVSNTDSYTQYVMQAQGVRKFTSESFLVGDKLYDEESDKYIGEIVWVKKEPGKDFVTTSTGQLVNASMPERETLSIGVKCPAMLLDGCVVTKSGKQLYINKSMVCYTNKAQTTFKIEKLEME